MGKRVILYSPTGKGMEWLVASAKEYGFHVVTIQESDGVWTLTSSIADYLYAERPKAQDYNRKAEYALVNLNVSTFADLASKTTRETWRAITAAANGATFSRIVHGMRHVKAAFRDWHPQDYQHVKDTTELHPRAASTLEQGGVEELEVFKRLTVEDLKSISGIGGKLLSNVLQVRQAI